MRQRARAFTLIELLVVIVLLGILVSVAVLSVGGSSTRASCVTRRGGWRR